MGDPWKRKEVIARFEGKCVSVSESGCVIWMGAVNEHGYGTLSAGGLKFRAHRFAWMIENGFLASENFLLHSCDVPCCVSLEHLRIGTQSENIKESWARGRKNTKFARGEFQGSSVLTEGDVIRIRQLSEHMSKAEISRMFGVTRSNISSICHRKSWAHVR